MIGDKKNFFCYSPLNAGKLHPGKDIFPSMTLYNTQKPPLRNLYFHCKIYIRSSDVSTIDKNEMYEHEV